MSTLAELIKDLHTEGKTQADIAAMLNCSRSYISEVIRGKKGADKVVSKAELKRRLTVAIKALEEIKAYAQYPFAKEYKMAEKALQEVQK